jgi:hypothetical protein
MAKGWYGASRARHRVSTQTTGTIRPGRGDCGSGWWLDFRLFQLTTRSMTTGLFGSTFDPKNKPKRAFTCTRIGARQKWGKICLVHVSCLLVRIAPAIKKISASIPPDLFFYGVDTLARSCVLRLPSTSFDVSSSLASCTTALPPDSDGRIRHALWDVQIYPFVRLLTMVRPRSFFLVWAQTCFHFGPGTNGSSCFTQTWSPTFRSWSPAFRQVDSSFGYTQEWNQVTKSQLHNTQASKSLLLHKHKSTCSRS